MATNHEIWVAYVNTDKTLSTRRVMADNPQALADIRDVIQVRFRKCIGGQHFEDKYDGWPVFKLDNAKGPGDDFANVVRYRPKDGPAAAEAKQIAYHHADFVVNENPNTKDLNSKVLDSAGGGSGARLYGYDEDASDFQTLLDSANVLVSTDTPLTV